MAVSMSLGAAACALLSWRVRKCPDWTVKTLPWLALAPAWTYSWNHDTLVWTIPALVFALDAFDGRKAVPRIRFHGFLLFVFAGWMMSATTFAVYMKRGLEILQRHNSAVAGRLDAVWAQFMGADLSLQISKILLFAVFVMFAVWLWKHADAACKPRADFANNTNIPQT